MKKGKLCHPHAQKVSPHVVSVSSGSGHFAVPRVPGILPPSSAEARQPCHETCRLSYVSLTSCCLDTLCSKIDTSYEYKLFIHTIDNCMHTIQLSLAFRSIPKFTSTHLHIALCQGASCCENDICIGISTDNNSDRDDNGT